MTRVELLEEHFELSASVDEPVSRDDPALADFTAYVRDPGNHYA